MALTVQGELIDPFGGRRDLAARVLRHVSPAFAEDPVRILRVARFAARFADFEVAPVYLKAVHRIQALLCVYFFALLVEALLERQLRRAMQRDDIEALPLYPEGRPCRWPTARRVMELFESVQRQARKTEANRASVRLELQADCLAGVWAIHTEQSQQAQSKGFLDTGDVEEALQAASMIGDDKLQMESQGYVVPESFTHGSAEQRMQWFKQGFQSGTVQACNTFK
jgi:hypothetical protein